MSEIDDSSGNADVPVKRTSRLVVLDPADRVLLFRYHEAFRPPLASRPPFWATAGGRLEPGEGYLEAARRELWEETGFDAPIGPLLRVSDDVFAFAGTELARWIEHFFLVECAGGTPDRTHWTDQEQQTIREHRWWSLAELKATQDTVLPPWLPELFESACAQRELRITRIHELPEDFENLVALSLREDFAAMRRMRDDWNSGANRFDRPGEVVFEARVGSRLAGICGLNRDPYADSPEVGRVRHLYVDPAFRRRGVGRALVAQIVDAAACSFARLRLRTLRADADLFYVAIGFQRVADAPDVTHEYDYSSSGRPMLTRSSTA
jgi:8-oxo-dGTP diphosphatase